MEYVYVIKLESYKYFIGRAINVGKDYQVHVNGSANEWTKLYKAIAIEKISELNVERGCTDDLWTKDYMRRFGIDNVQGGKYINMSLDQRQSLQCELWHEDNKCTLCGNVGHVANNCTQIVAPATTASMVELAQDNQAELSLFMSSGGANVIGLRKLCKYFKRSNGCKNGENCGFLHQQVVQPPLLNNSKNFQPSTLISAVVTTTPTKQFVRRDAISRLNSALNAPREKAPVLDNVSMASTIADDDDFSEFSREDDLRGLNSEAFKVCYRCGKMGHIARYCSEINLENENGLVVCPRCRRAGHLTANCRAHFDVDGNVLWSNEEDCENRCSRCLRYGHNVKSCFANYDTAGNKFWTDSAPHCNYGAPYCTRCSRYGHESSHCQKRYHSGGWALDCLENNRPASRPQTPIRQLGNIVPREVLYDDSPMYTPQHNQVPVQVNNLLRRLNTPRVEPNLNPPSRRPHINARRQANRLQSFVSPEFLINESKHNSPKKRRTPPDFIVLPFGDKRKIKSDVQNGYVSDDFYDIVEDNDIISFRKKRMKTESVVYLDA